MAATGHPGGPPPRGPQASPLWRKKGLLIKALPSVRELESVAIRFFDAWSRHDVETMKSYCAHELKVEFSDREDTDYKEDYEAFHRRVADSFRDMPDLRVGIICEGVSEFASAGPVAGVSVVAKFKSAKAAFKETREINVFLDERKRIVGLEYYTSL